MGRHHDKDDDRKGRDKKRHSKDDTKKRKRRSSKADDDDESSRRDHDRHRHRKRSRSSLAHEEDSKDRRKSKKHKKSHKKSKDSKQVSSKKSKSKRKPDKSSLVPMGDPVGTPPETRIDSEKDYFAYHQQFWVFLFREEGIAFNELSSEQAHERFAKFVKRYNQGQLEAPYYDGSFPPQVLEESKTTQHKWSFQTTTTERRGLEALQQGVRQQTEYVALSEKDAATAAADTRGRVIPPPSAQRYEETGRLTSTKSTPQERLEERRANRRLREHVRTTHEELTGGAKDLRERRLGAKRVETERLHGAQRDKEEQAGSMELTDDVIYGSSGPSLESALSRERKHKERKEQRQKSRIEELQSKEKERQKNMLLMLGLDASALKGQKIKIAPRNDHNS